MTLRADRRPLGEWPDGRWARAIAIPVVQNGLYNRASKAVALARVLAGTTTEHKVVGLVGSPTSRPTSSVTKFLR
jgi:hypothetical protein